MNKIKAPRVWLAPMSGATDAPMRRQAVRFGAPAVVSEMVAGETLAAARPDMVRRTCRHEGGGLWIVQLAARRPSDMLAGAKLMAEAGVDVIDINMGCPARKVTGGQSGSALMREPVLAEEIIHAAIEGAGGRTVTLKMRLGWDDASLNAPDLAQAAERAGVSMLTVHGRTRCQFYKGVADWSAVKHTVDAVSIPVIVNGDIEDVVSASQALRKSGAHGVMIGRAAMGRPWLIGQVAAELAGKAYSPPLLEEQIDSLIEQIDDSISLYGDHLGIRTVRKHVSAFADRVLAKEHESRRRSVRGALCTITDAGSLKRALRDTSSRAYA